MAVTDSVYNVMCHNQASPKHRRRKVVSKYNEDRWLVMLSLPMMS